MVNDEVNKGTRNSSADFTAASMGLIPVDIRTMIDSETTIALSTSSPRAMIKAANDI